jgi:hypothetical protein
MNFRTWVENDDFKIDLSNKPDQSKAKAAIDDIQQLGRINAMNHHETIIDGVAVELAPSWDGSVWLRSIRAMTPGSGAGTKVMERINQIADKHGVRLEVQPVPFGNDKVGVKRLMEFYRRLGFSGGPRGMYREPAPTAERPLKLGNKFHNPYGD